MLHMEAGAEVILCMFERDSLPGRIIRMESEVGDDLPSAGGDGDMVRLESIQDTVDLILLDLIHGDGCMRAVTARYDGIEEMGYHSTTGTW